MIQETLKQLSVRVCQYFLDFLESDFKRQQAPRRRIVLHNESGFRAGMCGTTSDQLGQEPALSSSLESIYQLNERCVSLIAQAAQEITTGQAPLIRCLKGSLACLTARERSRAARRSFLLLNLEFSNPKAWAGFIAHPTRSMAAPDRHVWFPALGGRALARATLTALWHSLRNDPQVTYRFGLSPSVLELIRPLTLGHLEQIGERQCRWLKPRWADSPGIWQELLSNSGQYRVARELSARTLQLMMGAVLTHERPFL